MRLIELRLQNFRQFRHAEVVFSPGLTAIVGPNGSGKTTLLEAITWALYGENRKTRDTLRYFYADPNEPTAVKLTFALGESLFLVERNLRTATLKQTYPKESSLASGLRPVTEKVERLLNLTYEQFKNSYYTEQKDLTFLRFSRTGREQEEIARMLGYDLIRTAAQKARDKANEFRAAYSALVPSLSAFADAQNHYDEALKTVEIARQEVLHLTEIEKSLSEKYQQAKQESLIAQNVINLSQQVEAQKRNLKNLKEQLKDLEEDIQSALSMKARRESLQPIAEEYEKLLARQKELRQIQDLFRERLRLETTAKTLSEQLQTLKSELQGVPPNAHDAERLATNLQKHFEHAKQTYENKGRKLHEEKTHALAQVKSLLNEVKRIQRDLEQLQRSVKEGRCPTCGQPLPEGRLPQESHLQAELLQKNGNLQQAENTLRNIEKQIARWEKERETVARAEQAYREAKEALQMEIQRMRLWKQNEEKARKIQNLIAECQQKIAKLPHHVDENLLRQIETQLEQNEPAWREFQQLASIEETLKTLQTRREKTLQQKEENEYQCQELENQISTFGMSLKEASDAINRFADVQSQWQKAQSDLRVAQNQLQNEIKHLAETEQRLKECQKIQKEAERLASQRLLYETLREALETWRITLNAQTLPLLEAYAGEFLALLSGNRYDHVTLDEHFEPTLYEDNIAKPVISGGEQDLLALALRLALARLIQERSGQPLSLLILDEVFGSLDPERRRSVLEQLEALRGSFEQILAISHIEQINEAADRCLLVQYDPLKKESHIAEYLPEFQPTSSPPVNGMQVVME